MNLSDAISVIGAVIGVLALIAAVVYAKAHGKPAFRQAGNRVVAASPADRITVQYDGEDVPYVTRTRIAFWNAGSKTLNRSDIADSYPIQFQFRGDDVKILSVGTLCFSDDANVFQVQKDKSGSRVQVSFDYLEPRQGAVIEVFHTSAEWNAKAFGKIKGVPKGVHEVPSTEVTSSPLFSVLSGMIFASAVALLILILVLMSKFGGPIPIRVTLIGIFIAFLGWLGIIGWRNVTEPRKLSLNK